MNSMPILRTVCAVFLFSLLMHPPCQRAWGLTYVPGSLIDASGGSGVSTPGGNEDIAVSDGRPGMYGQIDISTVAAIPEWTYDLENAQAVESVAFWSWGGASVAHSQMPSGNISILVADSVEGPYTLAGSLTRTMNRDDFEFPNSNATHGEGFRVPCNGLSGRYVKARVETPGTLGGLDNHWRIRLFQVNPGPIIHGVQDAEGRSDVNDFPRIPFNSVDNQLNTTWNPLRGALQVDYDLGPAPILFDRIVLTPDVTSGSDGHALPRKGTISVSSTEDPEAFDTVLTTFDILPPNVNTDNAVIDLPHPVTARFVRLEWTETRNPNQLGNQTRIGETFFLYVMNPTATPANTATPSLTPTPSTTPPTPTPSLTPTPTRTPIPTSTPVPDAVDVTLCGVVPDDGLDDSQAFRNCLQNHSSLYLPPGVYDFFSTVYIPSNRSIAGAGMNSVTIELRTDTVAFRVEEQSNISISEIGIDRPFDNSREEMIFIYRRPGGARPSNIHLERIKSTNNRSRAPALRYIEAENSSIRYCLVIDTQRMIFEDGHLYTYGSGITCENCLGIMVECNTVLETRDLTIENSTLAGINTYYQAGAIQISGSSDAEVIGNRVHVSGNGIDAGGATNVLIEGNRVDNCQATGIKLVNGSAFQLVRNNFVTRCGNQGIALAPGNTELAVHDSVVENNVLALMGEGVGKDYFDGWFSNTVPSAIHLDTPNIPSGRLYDNTIRNNIIYDDDDMVAAIVDRPATYSSINTVIEDNILLSEEPPEDLEVCADESLDSIPTPTPTPMDSGVSSWRIY